MAIRLSRDKAHLLLAKESSATPANTNRRGAHGAGLCFALGISRETYNQYKKDKFSDTINGFELYIESNWVRRLAGQAATGAIFYLKNAFAADYRDRTETDVTSGGEKVRGFQLIPPNGSSDKANR